MAHTAQDVSTNLYLESIEIYIRTFRKMYKYVQLCRLFYSKLFHILNQHEGRQSINGVSQQTYV